MSNMNWTTPRAKEIAATLGKIPDNAKAAKALGVSRATIAVYRHEFRKARGVVLAKPAVKMPSLRTNGTQAASLQTLESDLMRQRDELTTRLSHINGALIAIRRLV